MIEAANCCYCVGVSARFGARISGLFGGLRELVGLCTCWQIMVMC